MKSSKIIFHLSLFLLIFHLIPENGFTQSITLQVTPSFQNINITQNTIFNISVIPTGGFSQQVFFNINSTNLPSGYSSGFSINPVSSPYTGGSIFNIQPNALNTPDGNYYIVLEAGNGPILVSDTIRLSITSGTCNWTIFSHIPTITSGYNTLAVDHNNNIWIGGGTNGIERFDGLNWTSYNSSNSPFPSGTVTKILFDSLNNLWATVEGAGLVKYDGTFWSIYNMGNSNIPAVDLHDLAIDAQGNKWFTCGNFYCQGTYVKDIVKFDGTSFTAYNSCNNPFLDGVDNKISIDKNGTVVCAGIHQLTHQIFFAKFNGSGWTYLYDLTCGPFEYTINAFQFDSQNNLWAAVGVNAVPASSGGILKINHNFIEMWNGSTVTPFNHWKSTYGCSNIIQDNASQLPGGDAANLYIDKNDNIWISSTPSGYHDYTGITRFDGSAWETYTTGNSSLSSNNAYSFVQDNNNNIWCGFYDMKLAESNCNTVSGILLSQFTNTIKIFPNPFSDQTEILFSDELPAGKNELFLYSVTGELVKHLSLNNKENYLFRGSLSPGIYFYSVKNEQKELWKGKMIITD